MHVSEALVGGGELEVVVEGAQDGADVGLPVLGALGEAGEGGDQLDAEVVVVRARADGQLGGDAPLAGRDRVGPVARDVVGNAGAGQLGADLVLESRGGLVVALAAAENEAEGDAEEKVRDVAGRGRWPLANVGAGTPVGLGLIVASKGGLGRVDEVRHGGQWDGQAPGERSQPGWV